MYNHINYFDVNQLNRKMTNVINDSPNLFDAIEALSKGNSDKNLYDPYKNYIPQNLNVNNLENKLKAYYFMLIDLQLYLDVHPEDYQMKKTFDKYLEMYKKSEESLEKAKGPLCLTSEDQFTSSNWEWQKDWPFEGKKK